MSESPRPLLTLAMPNVIVIPDWERCFENAKSRSVERASFFCVQNNFDGSKIRRLQKLKKSLELYGAFHAMCAIASRCFYRGVLLDHAGPIDEFSLSEKTGFPSKPLKNAIVQLSKKEIGLLQVHPIEFKDGEWILPDTVRTWAIPQDTRRPRAIHGDTARTPKSPSETKRPHLASGHSESPGDTPRTSAILGDTASPPSIAEVRAGPKKGSEGKRSEEDPLPSPDGGQEGIAFDEAKKRLNHLFGRGKRHWSYEEMDLLRKVCPIDRAEWTLIETWFGLPADHPVFEVTKRKQELTTFLRDFNGELDKIRRHASLFAAWAQNGGSRKKEPVRVQEFYRWHYGDPHFVVRGSFWDIPEEKRKIYDQRFAEFELAKPEVAA